MENTQINFMPRIGDNAPDFEAISTVGKIKLSDYAKGSWVILFSHPADFTPVCTTELTGFAMEEENFKSVNTKLIGVSVDSIHSHIAWVSNVNKNLGVMMRFPLIADTDMKVAKLYGMIQPGESETAAVRAVFFIDPNMKIRLIMYYPLNVGRNMAEIKRTLKALQTVDTHKVACPLNWNEGDKVIVPAPKTIEDLEIREKSDLEMIDFYLAKKSI
ncbi:MAG: peroxiredoxin [Cytophagales bacterium]|nr:MAG: peroxiredoxin [Cytophagales bacterium]